MGSLIYGINSVLESLRGRQRKALELLVDRNSASPRLAVVRDEATRRRVTINPVSRQELDLLSGGERHQGVALRVEEIASIQLEDLLAMWRSSEKKGLFLVLDGITDPHNLGALARSAEASGCQGMILPKDRSCSITATAEKASAGALAHLPVCRVTNIARTLDTLKREGFWVFGLAGEAGALNLFEADLSGHVVLVVGDEGKGLRDNVRKHCDNLLSIPMRGQISSLNASVAGGIALFEVLRQQVD
ncbi:MAG: 23S rRNA (guanosine(2251)-2'-O)-methyltransferase RlmB [Pedobacter sp.]